MITDKNELFDSACGNNKFSLDTIAILSGWNNARFVRIIGQNNTERLIGTISFNSGQKEEET